jgi:hypothetical protein
MKNINKKILILLLFAFLNNSNNFCGIYKDRFLELYNNIHTNGCLSPEGLPYHSREKRIVEATDYGHCSTSEGISFLIWLEAMYDYITNNTSFSNLKKAWNLCETYYIPPSQEQPNFAYNPSKPASVVSEHKLLTGYPSAVDQGAPVGSDPIYSSVTSATGRSTPYLLHWYLDIDDWLGYGRAYSIGILGTGNRRIVKTNTFQRGPNESTWETIHHPSFDKYATGTNGYVDLFVQSNSPQWRYTSAPDAEARIAQAMYWAELWATEKNAISTIQQEINKTKNLGHWMRYCLFDKYFRQIGNAGTAGNGYNSCHYLISWYIAWGGPVNNEGWGWIIGCHSAHNGYQNPLAAYYWSNKGVPDWDKSLKTQLELAKFVQVPEGHLGAGAFGGGVANDYPDDDVNYTHPSAPVFKPSTYTNGQQGMKYTHHPVYWDPGSNTWCGWQYWFSERLAQFYYLQPTTSSYLSDTYEILSKWMDLWAVPNFKVKISGTWYTADQLTVDDLKDTSQIEDVNIPVSFAKWDWLNPNDPEKSNPLDAPGEMQSTSRWQGWNGIGPGDPNYGAEVEAWGHDVGLMGAFVKCLIFYHQGLLKHNHTAKFEPDFYKYLAKAILDTMWKNFKTDLGISAPEVRTDYIRFNDTSISTVYVPQTKQIPNLGTLQAGNRAFSETRPDYGEPIPQDYTFTYHRTWQQAAFALALGYYSLYEDRDNPPTITLVSPSTTAVLSSQVNIQANIKDDFGLSKVELWIDNQKLFEEISFDTNSYILNYPWDSTSVLDGTHTLKIVAVDTSTQTTQVEYRITTDNNPAPYVEILSPQNNSYVSGVVQINIKAEDNTDYVSSVILRIYRGAVLITSYTFTTSSYIYEWDTTNLSTATVYRIQAVAYDNYGESSSTQVSVRIIRIENDNPPTVVITSPSSNSQFNIGDIINVSYTVSDDVQIARIDFLINNQIQNSLYPLTTYYSDIWSINTLNLSSGTYELKIQAVDNVGYTSYAFVSIVIKSTQTTTQPPNDNNLPPNNNDNNNNNNNQQQVVEKKYIIVTPNNDGVNDKVVFSESYVFDVFTKDGFKVYSGEGNNWEAKDFFGRTVPNGLYILKTNKNKIFFVLVAR